MTPSTAPPALVALNDSTFLDLEAREDEWDLPIFAFQDLDYIPSGYSGILAPYIETGPGTMRAAATLMNLDLPRTNLTPPQRICDLGCGDAEFLLGLLHHLNTLPSTTYPLPPPTSGFGIDYSPTLIATAQTNSLLLPNLTPSTFLIYDFNLDLHDLYSQIEKEGVTHVFVYLVPKQLALGTVRRLLERLCEGGVVICCHKFQPGYLRESRRDELMDLVVYERDEGAI